MTIQREAKRYEEELRGLAASLPSFRPGVSTAQRLRSIADFLSMVAAQKEGVK